VGYDAKGQIRTVTLPALASTASVPAITAGVATMIPKSARKLTLDYNAAGDIASLADAQNNEDKFTADALGRIHVSTDPLGYSTKTEYNNLDQPTKVTNALEKDAQFGYDSAARLIGVSNEAGVMVEGYGYDANGRISRITDALSQSTNIVYDQSGRPSRTTDRKGQVTTIAYNERGDINQIAKPGHTVDFQYDAAGRLIEVRDAVSVTTYQYDAADRITETGITTAAGSHRRHYEYDSLDRVTKRTLTGTGILIPDITIYAWDKAGRIVSHSTTTGGQTHATHYEYDAAGRLAARKIQAGVQQDAITQRYGYDSADRLAQIRYVKAEGASGEQLIEQIDYSYDAKGQRTSKTSLNNSGMGAQETPMSVVYDTANRMSSLTLTVGTSTKTYTLSYDQNGNLLQKQNAADAADSTVYNWDANNRLVGLTQADLNANFSYDAWDRRIQATVTKAGQAPQTVQYLYEGEQVLGEVRDGKLSHRLLTGLALDESIARMAIAANGQKDVAGSRIYLTDALDSVIAQFTDDGLAAATGYGYSPYGEVLTIGPDGTANPIQYTGRENDGTGLYFYRARYYDPVLKRFISEDPIGLQGGLNVYAYVTGNPVSLSDPLGLAGHKKGARKSTEDKHEKGDERRNRDKGGEKGDERRDPRKDELPSRREQEKELRKAACFAAYSQCIRTAANCPSFPGKALITLICTGALAECLSN
jgi:RHS repeat-associated protein